MRIRWEALPVYSRPERTPLYGPVLLVLLAACSGGGGGGGGGQTAAFANGSTSSGGPKTETEPDDKDDPKIPFRPSDPKEPAGPPDPPDPKDPVPTGTVFSEIDVPLPEFRLQPLPENQPVDTDKVLFTVSTRLQDDNDKTLKSSGILIGGRDKDSFTIDQDTGQLFFKARTTPDFEDPKRTDHLYEVSITVDYDGKHSVKYSKIIIPVSNENEGPARLSLTLPQDGQLVSGAELTALLSGDPDGDPAAKDIVWQWQWLDKQVWTDLSGNGADSTDV